MATTNPFHPFSTGTRLAPKTAIVTGASCGIGRAIALAYAAQGAKVLCADLRPDVDPSRTDAVPAMPTHEEIVQAGGQALFFKTDVTVDGDVKAAVERCVEEWGRLDVMVNNAGVSLEGLAPGPIYAAREDIWDRTMAINLKGVWSGCKHASAQMMTQEPLPNGGGDRGWIVNIGSIMGMVSMRASPAYVASKHAVIGLTKSVGVDLAPFRIHANCVAPGFAETPLLTAATALISPEEMQGLHALHPLKGLGQAEDIAKAAVFFASEDASWVTGASLAVDGGYSAL